MCIRKNRPVCRGHQMFATGHRSKVRSDHPVDRPTTLASVYRRCAQCILHHQANNPTSELWIALRSCEKRGVDVCEMGREVRLVVVGEVAVRRQERGARSLTQALDHQPE